LTVKASIFCFWNPNLPIFGWGLRANFSKKEHRAAAVSTNQEAKISLFTPKCPKNALF
jgi:hypothetical protein